MVPAKSTFGFVLQFLLLLVLVEAGRKVEAAGNSRDNSWEIDAQTRFIEDARVHGDGLQHGSAEELATDLSCVLWSQISPNVLLRLGADWQRLSFDVPKVVPVPSVLQKVSTIIGLDYQLTDKWLLRAEVQPGLYSDFQNISWGDVDVPMILGAAYLANADLQWLFGLRVDPRSRYPVLPAAGVHWRFADRWTLNLVVPNPRLELELSDKVQAYLGAGIDLGTYSVADHFGDERGRPDLNRATLDYSEIRVGPGLSWKLGPKFSLEAEAGYTVYRRFDFHDEHLLLRPEPSPYVQITGHIRF